MSEEEDLVKLVETLSTLVNSTDFFLTFRTVSLKLGFHTFYSILKYGVQEIGRDNDDESSKKLGLENWTQSQIQSVLSIGLLIASTTRSLPVEQVETVVVATLHRSIEFALSCLEKLKLHGDDFSLQNTAMKLLEAGLLGQIDSEFDSCQSSGASSLVAGLPSVLNKENDSVIEQHTLCSEQGVGCSNEKPPVDQLLATLASNLMQSDMTKSPMESAYPREFNTLVSSSQHWAVVHLGCIHRLLSSCHELVQFPETCDVKVVELSLRRKLTASFNILKLLRNLVGSIPFLEVDQSLLKCIAAFVDVVPSIFRLQVDFVCGHVNSENNYDGMVLNILEEFLNFVQLLSCGRSVLKNVMVGVLASIIVILDPTIWRYNKSVSNFKVPLVYFPRCVSYFVKLIGEVINNKHQMHVENGLNKDISLPIADTEVESVSNIHCGNVVLVKNYTVEELLQIIFPKSVQWVDNLLHLLVFLHSEGVKLQPKLERSCSSGAKPSCYSELESTVSHDDEALFGDLFSEGGRSVGSNDGYEQSSLVPNPQAGFYIIIIQAAVELSIFLKSCVFSSEWSSSVYENACNKLRKDHIDSLLSLLGCQSLEPDEFDGGAAMNELRKTEQILEVCFEMVQGLLKSHAISEELEEYLVHKILEIKSGSFTYNVQTLALLAHILIYRVGSSGSHLRNKVYTEFVNFIVEKEKEIHLNCPSLKELAMSLPYVFHMEIVLMAFHLSSESEKAELAELIISTLKTFAARTDGLDNLQLSCWGLIVSRVIVILRHLMLNPHGCPTSLLLDFRSKLNAARFVGIHDRHVNDVTVTWLSPAVDYVMGLCTEPLPGNLLNHLLDFESKSGRLSFVEGVVECSSLSLNKVCNVFSQISRLWRGRKGETVEDLIIERYFFLLCWDMPGAMLTLVSPFVLSISDNDLDASNMEFFIQFSHLFLGRLDNSSSQVDVMDMSIKLLQRLYAVPMSDDVNEFSWDLLRSGQCLSLILSYINTGFRSYCVKNSVAGVNFFMAENKSDLEFVASAEAFACKILDAGRVPLVLKILSTLLARYIKAYEHAFLATFGDNQSCSLSCSRLLLLKHTEFSDLKDENMLVHDHVHAQLDSAYGLFSKIENVISKKSLGVLGTIFSECMLHGFPSHPQTSSGALISCMLSIRGIICFLDLLFKIKDTNGGFSLETDQLQEIFCSVMVVKYDKLFQNLGEKCSDICRGCTGSSGPDFSMLFLMSQIESFLRDIIQSANSDHSKAEQLVVKAVDIMESLVKDPSRISIFTFYVGADDVSQQAVDLYGSLRGDLFVLIDSLHSCQSEAVNVKVLNFFVDVLSGDLCPNVKHAVQKKFLDMDIGCVSKWFEKRLLGYPAEDSSGLTRSHGSSVSLKESTMSFVQCLVSRDDPLCKDLYPHLFDALRLSLETAFEVHDINTAKSYFGFVVQLLRDEASMRSLLESSLSLMEKLAAHDHQLQGIKFLLNFFESILCDSGSLSTLPAKNSGKSFRGSTAGSKKHSETLVLSSTQDERSATFECDAASMDEDEDDGTSDGEVGSIDKDDEDDSSSERLLASKVCTFTSSGSNFMEQHWYFCYTCDLTVSKGCCSVCAKVCHRGHRVVYSRSSRFFCDCGAGGVRGSTCQCLKPRKFIGSSATQAGPTTANFQPLLSFTEEGDQMPDSDSDPDDYVFMEADNSLRFSIPTDIQGVIHRLYEELDFEAQVLKICNLLLPSVTRRRDCNVSRDKDIILGGDKIVSPGSDLLQLKKSYKSGSLDLKIKAEYSNSKELRSLLASGSLMKSLLSVSIRGRLAVGEGDKVAIFDVGQLIGQATVAPVTADKTNVKPLSKNVVRFEIVHLVFNPLVENYLAVVGYEDCQVFTVSPRGEVTDRLAIELALQGAYIRKVDWIPGSQVQLMVVTNRFVKIYDLSQDNISPLHYFTLPDQMIVDAVISVASQGKVYLVVFSESGSLFKLELSTEGNVGTKELNEIVEVPSRDVLVKGLSLYFSSTYKLLFVSYQDGSTIVGRLNVSATSLTEMSSIYEDEQDGKRRSAGLHHLKEFLLGSGLFICFSTWKSNSAFAISIGVNDIFAQSLRHAVGSNSSVVGATAYKPISKDRFHTLVLYDDGSLQIFSHAQNGPDSVSNPAAEKVKKLGPNILSNKAYSSENPEFPLDFFEKTVCITSDVKLGGDAIRNGDSEGAKQSLASEDGFLESSSPSGFKIIVSNSNPDIVIVGIRVHVGNTSANYIPSDISIFQRVIKLDEGMRCWYDIPFTVAECLLADEEIVVSVGPTFNSSAFPRIDSLEVYGRHKDEFGWKEKMEAVLDMEARALGSNSWTTTSRKKYHSIQSAPVEEQVLGDGLKLLSGLYQLCKPQGCSRLEDARMELGTLKCRPLLETIFESDRELLLQSAACRILQAMFPKKEIYYNVKDSMRLPGVLKSTAMLLSRLGIGGSTSTWIIEEFTAQMRAVTRIAVHRRSNLAAFLETNGSQVVDALMQVLWGILEIEQPDTQTMNSIVISSVELIYCYAECLVLHGKDADGHSVSPAVTLLKKLLFFPNEAVQTASSLAISSRLLQVPFPKQTMLATDDAAEHATSGSSYADAMAAPEGTTQAMIEEDSMTSSVQYCCDGCSTVPILRRRWHCSICPDFDLCEACHEVLDSDRLPPPHSRDHPMTAIPIEMETLGGEGNVMQFSEELSDPSILPMSSPSNVQSSTPSIHVLEPNEPGDFSAAVLDPVSISASTRAVNSLLLSELLEQLGGWMETTSGIQAIPVMQLFYRLSSAVGGPFIHRSKPDSLDLENLINCFLVEINLNKQFAARKRSNRGEVTILLFMFFTLMLRNWHQPGNDASGPKSGISDAHDRNHTQNSLSAPVASGVPSDDQEKNDFASQLLRACTTLRQQSVVNHLMDILQQLVHVFKSSSGNLEGSTDIHPGSSCGALLTVRRELPAGNFSPFFSDSYAKAHRVDIFADYHRLLLENTFRLVYSLVRPEKHDKTGEREKAYKISSSKELKLDGYQDVLCSYINNTHTTFVRRYARRLFLHLCGSKSHYYSVRDSWQFSSELKKLHKHVNKTGCFQNPVSYERSVKIIKCLSTMAEVATSRPRNWQKYCLRHGDVLPLLLKWIFYLGEESVIQMLKLLNVAFYTGKDVNHPSKKTESGDAGMSSIRSSTQPHESKKKKRGEDGTESGSEKSLLDMDVAVEIFADKSGEVLIQFIDCFLLEWNSSAVRSEAKSVLQGMWLHGKPVFKEMVLKLLLQKVKCLPMYGPNVAEYTELLAGLLGKVPDVSSKQLSSDLLDKCLTSDVIQCFYDTLHSQNELLANHPNSRIYNTLSGLVEFDGYYLESEPCVSCSSPEVPYSRMKLESLKSETKFTDNRIIVKCTGSYTIQSVTMNVHDARKSKTVKILNMYYNNRPVTDLSELKNNWSLWKRAKSCQLTFSQTELKVDFPIPITACNFMIELDSFYENLQASSMEPLQCPRCSRPVTDRHGICSNCHENAYQCRQCRNINYENLDSFLCNECGYSKYGRFEFNFMAKPSFTFDTMENDDDMKRGLAAIESESENAHRRYQQLLGFKKPLLKIVSSIGENDLDSQQKDSVQQMMVSLPGPSCKINRKIALLGVLYGEKCKAAFDSVSKSVQTLQGLRRVLMNYLHQKHCAKASESSRFIVSRAPSSCYGCATTFVVQCLEILQVLSKHSSFKKQLVSLGILTELFENNIHQGPKSARAQARAVLCAFSEGDMSAVGQLNILIQKKVLYCLEHHRSMDIAVATREEMLLLSEVCSSTDEFWESRLRVVFQLLFTSIKVGSNHPAISEHVILPCLRIISQACTPPKPDIVDKEAGGKSSQTSPIKDDNSQVPPSTFGSTASGGKSVSESVERNWDGSQKAQDVHILSYSEWEKGASYLDFVRRQYRVTQAFKGSGHRSRPQRYDFLALKYGLRWKRRACARNSLLSFELGSWVSGLILSACSQSIRSEMCILVNLLCSQSSPRRFRLLNLLMAWLPLTLPAAENAVEYFELLFKMIDTEDARLFLTVRGCLSNICKLITQEVNNIESLERSLHIDISQGFILHKLIELLGNFLEIPNIRARFMRDNLLSEVLEALIVIRGLVVQKTKLISDCNRLLKDILDSLLQESGENKRQFIKACINGLQIHGDEKKGQTSLFILEQLCNLICPSKPESVYHLVLNKSHTQEEFIRGSMTKNPYSSAEVGPLMRDVKNKICHQLDLMGLVEDDYGMELLVAGNIISLDLSIGLVYEQVWKKANVASSNSGANLSGLPSGGAASTRDGPPMIVTYRLQGLDGEATEPMIKELEEDREESQDPEVEFVIAGAVRNYGGLEIILDMTKRLRVDLKSNHDQLIAVLNLLMLCCKIRENRCALLRLGALGLLLDTARRAFSVDAMEAAEGILLIVESLTLEANNSDSISIGQSGLKVSSEESGASEQAKKMVLMFLERLSHPSGLKKSNKQQRNTEMVARILPYLTYGEPSAMEALVQHFDSYLQNWAEFDRLQKQHEDNPKDETIAQQAAEQRFAVENFVRVSESLKTSSCGERLKDIILERGITRVAVQHLRESFSIAGQPGHKSTPDWGLGLKLPSVPLILSMLKGLSMGHLATQNCIDEGGILPLLHSLEGVSGENEIGARAENLLDTLSDMEGQGDGFLGEKILKLRHATKDEMRRRALKKREELLQGLGMRQELSSDGGERIVVAQPNLEGFEEVEEEEGGLACMVCREGYSLRPNDLLGVYTYSKRVNLGVGNSASSRGECVYTTVSHFNIIHFQCHQEAKRADAGLKNPKKEWEGATLRNNETLCNALFPVRGPAVPLAQYARYVDQYWDSLNALGRADGTRLRLLMHDIVLILARFATGASFSVDSKGGGKESNSKFLPFMIQMARYLLDQGSTSQRQSMSKAISSYLTSSSDSRTFPTSPLQPPTTGSEETVQFMMVSSLLTESYESWLEHRRSFLQRGVYHAYMQHTNSKSVSRAMGPTGTASKSETASTSGNNDLLPIVQPMLVYTGLIEQLHQFFKPRKSGSGGPTGGGEVDGENEEEEAWEVVMKEKVLNVRDLVGFSKELLSWLDDMSSVRDLQEAFDVIGALSDVLSGGFKSCEEFVQAAINAGKS